MLPLVFRSSYQKFVAVSNATEPLYVATLLALVDTQVRVPTIALGAFERFDQMIILVVDEDPTAFS